MPLSVPISAASALDHVDQAQIFPRAKDGVKESIIKGERPGINAGPGKMEDQCWARERRMRRMKIIPFLYPTPSCHNIIISIVTSILL